MYSDFKLNLSAVWLGASLLSLALPVFISSFDSGSSSYFSSVVGSASTSMFILAFPSSLFGLPVLLFAHAVLGVDSASIGGMYLNLFILFVLGAVQWFWIVPRIFGKAATDIQTLDLPKERNAQLLKPQPVNEFEFYDSDDKTPLERAIYNSDQS